MNRKPLPIDDMLGEIVEALQAAGSVVVEAAPGAGKTTRVPVAMANADVGEGGQVVVLQPRRVAARAAARRIAAENGWRLGAEVGYHVRFDAKHGPTTRILVVTEGLFLSMLQRDPFLDGVGAVVFDEFHERSLDLDLSLAMARRVQRQVREDLRLVVMSATLDGESVASYLGGCPRLVCPVRQHPVRTSYARHRIDGDPAIAAAEAVSRVAGEPGDVLVFLPGVAWINRCERELASRLPMGRSMVVPLHGRLSAAEQDQALKPSPRQKIVLATNIAETSLTIDGVRTVVDSGLARVLRYDRGVELNRLETVRIGLASAEQRAGRAGRQGPGRCLRLWTEGEHSSLREAELPEIRRLELSEVVLQLLAWGETDVESFPWFDAPPRRALDSALRLLRATGALDDGGLTADGRLMARLPVSPRLARLLLEGRAHGCVEEAAWMVAALAEGLPAGHSAGDLVALARDHASDRSKGGSSARLALVGKVRKDLVRILESSAGGSARRRTGLEEALGRAMLMAFPDRVARVRRGDASRAVMAGGRGLWLGQHSGLEPGSLFVAAEVGAGDRRHRSEARVGHLVVVEAGWLPQDVVTTERSLEVDPTSGKVREWKKEMWHDLVISQVECAAGDPGEISKALIRYVVTDPAGHLDLQRPEVQTWLARLRSLAVWRPELGLPVFDDEAIREMLPMLCHGKKSMAELRRIPMVDVFSGFLTAEQAAALRTQAPKRLRVPSGSTIRLQYDPGKAPVLAVRIQELFGLAQSPTVAGGRVKVLIHLLAPNGRPQQITDDLANFWADTYHQVRSDLRGRYPKHHWPEDPLSAQPTARAKPRKKGK